MALARGWDQGRGHRAVLACVPGELHDIGLICFGLVLRRQGWRILYLGQDTPLETAAAALKRSRATTFVAVSVERRRFAAVADELADLGQRAAVAVGGKGATEARRAPHARDAARTTAHDRRDAAHVEGSRFPPQTTDTFMMADPYTEPAAVDLSDTLVMAVGHALPFAPPVVLLVAVLVATACGSTATSADRSSLPSRGSAAAPARTGTPPSIAIPTDAAGKPVMMVWMGDHYYSPSKLTVPLGTTVMWRMLGTQEHDVWSYDGSFHSPTMGPGSTFSHTFTKLGSFRYLCTPHSGDGMYGEIVVGERTGG